jgi:hypothetical protein
MQLSETVYLVLPMAWLYSIQALAFSTTGFRIAGIKSARSVPLQILFHNTLFQYLLVQVMIQVLVYPPLVLALTTNGN